MLSDGGECSSDHSRKVVLQMHWPGRTLLPRLNCWPAAPPGEEPPTSRRVAWGWPGWPCPQLKARRRAFAVTVCSGGKSWLFWERQIKACLTHTSFPRDTWPESGWSNQLPSRTPLPTSPSWSASIFHPNNHDRYQESNGERVGWILNPCQQFLLLFFWCWAVQVKLMNSSKRVNIALISSSSLSCQTTGRQVIIQDYQ